MKTVKSNLKKILDERDISIREFSRQTDITFELCRRMYNNETSRYPKEMLATMCEVLDIGLCELIELTDDPKPQ